MLIYEQSLEGMIKAAKVENKAARRRDVPHLYSRHINADEKSLLSTNLNQCSKLIKKRAKNDQRPES